MILNKKTEVFKVLMSHRIPWSYPGTIVYSCVPSVWKLLQLISKPVVYLCFPTCPHQDHPCCDKASAAAFILVFTVGLLYAGDKLVEVNGVSVDGLEPEQVINILVLNLF